MRVLGCGMIVLASSALSCIGEKAHPCVSSGLARLIEESNTIIVVRFANVPDGAPFAVAVEVVLKGSYESNYVMMDLDVGTEHIEIVMRTVRETVRSKGSTGVLFFGPFKQVRGSWVSADANILTPLEEERVGFLHLGNSWWDLEPPSTAETWSLGLGDVWMLQVWNGSTERLVRRIRGHLVNSAESSR